MARPPVLPKHVEFLEEHFQSSPNWKGFQNRLQSPNFREAVRKDPRADRKLKRFAKMVGFRQESKSRGVTVPSDTSGQYVIRYHPEVQRFSCTCGDWTYKRSVRNKGPSGDCKHITRLREGAKKTLQKTAMQVLPLIGIARSIHKRDQLEDQAKKLDIKHQAFKKHFPEPNLVEQYLKTASILGRAAKSLSRR